MINEIVRAISRDKQIKVSAITSTGIVERARQIHKTLPVCTAALGRTLSAASLLGIELKNEGFSVTLKINGDGPIGFITAVSDSDGNVRGYLQNPAVDIPRKQSGKLDVSAAVGRGRLTVIRDLQMKEPYTGTVELVSGEIAEDIASYFVTSEQIPTACALGVRVNRDQSVMAAGGYLIQLMPGADEALIEAVERGIVRAGYVTDLICSGLDAGSIITKVLSEFDMEILTRDEVSYKCYCDRERVIRALVSLGKEELYKIAGEQEQMNITCQFCDASYDFTQADALKLAEEI